MTDRTSLQSALRDFACLDGWNSPCAVTLTMKQALPVDNVVRSSYEWLTREKASANLRHFLNLLNRQIFGNNFKRNGQLVRCIPIIEGGSGSRLHYHLALDCPPGIPETLFELLIRRCWDRTDWGYGEVVVKSGADSGWISYITKSRTSRVLLMLWIGKTTTMNEVQDWMVDGLAGLDIAAQTEAPSGQMNDKASFYCSIDELVSEAEHHFMKVASTIIRKIEERTEITEALAQSILSGDRLLVGSDFGAAEFAGSCVT